MKYLYAPWRSEYAINHKCECVFCDIAQNADCDNENNVIYRDDTCFIVMNKYPYTVGHILVVPLFHADTIEKLDEKSWLHISLIVRQSTTLLKNELRADGVNIGMNLGRVAGPSIAEHVHYHVIPRRSGDTNFITTIADSRIFSTDFKRIYKILKNSIEKYVKNN